MKATIGTIIHGTMRPEDLIPEFMFELERLNQESATRVTVSAIGEGWPYSQCGLGFGDHAEKNPEQAEWLLEDLFEALNDEAPEYCYFGAHAGDGCDYGFWPSWEAIEDAEHDGDIRRIEDGTQTGSGIELAVNDHGNATLYVDGTEAWSMV